MKRFWPDIIAVTGIIAAVAIFFSPVAKGKFPIPTDALVGLYHPWRDFYANEYPRGIPYKNFLITDPIRQQIPWRKVAIDSWRRGEIPAWNPFNFSGTSLVGNIQAAVFYPLNILFFLLNFSAAWTVLIILQPLLAGAFLYLYLRGNNLLPLTCLFGAVTWAFSGFMMAWLTWGTIIHVVLWLPIILLSIDQLYKNRRLWGSLLVITLLFQFFGGHAQVSFYVVLLSGIYAIWRRAHFFWILLAISIVLSSVQWVPLIGSLLGSSRLSNANVWQTPGWFLPWQHIAQFFAPDFYGNPATLNYWGEWNYGEFIGYIGIVGIIFAIYSLLLSKKSASIKFWGATVGVTFLFLPPTPLAKLPYTLNIPILSSLQPTRIMAIVDFALVMLAAFGFEEWQKNRDRRIWFAVGATGVILLMLWAITPSLAAENLEVARRNLILPSFLVGLTSLVIALSSVSRKKIIMTCAALILVLMASFDLIRFGWKFTPFAPAEYFFPKTAIIEFLQKQPKPFRVMSTDPRIIPPNSLAYYGIESIEGYDPIYSSRYEEFMAALNRGKPDISAPFGFNRIFTATSIDSPLLSYMNVPFVLTLSDLDNSLLEKVFQEGEVRAYKMASMPRAYLTEGVREVTTKQESIEALYTLSTPWKEAIVEERVGVDAQPLDQGESVEIAHYKNSGMELVVRSNFARYLVIGNMYDRGWHVHLDGVEVPMYRTNFLFFGIVVPPGQHNITVQYQ